jgi:ABC-type nickel/cobalt efflux system permease component RcnA
VTTARPFFGALASLTLLREPISGALIAAGALMAGGAWRHLTERHEHDHPHETLDQPHRHERDEHHQHVHGGTWLPTSARVGTIMSRPYTGTLTTRTSTIATGTVDAWAGV